MYGWTREDFAQLMAIGKSHFDGWDVDGTEDSESDTAPAAVEESEAHSMHSNIATRYNNSYQFEVENTVVSDEADLN